MESSRDRSLRSASILPTDCKLNLFLVVSASKRCIKLLTHQNVIPAMTTSLSFYPEKFGLHAGVLAAVRKRGFYGVYNNFSAYRMAYGNESGIAVVDIVQKTCVLSMGTPDLYGSADPYQRVPRSPKRGGQPAAPSDFTNPGAREDDPRCRSPSTDQVTNLFISLA